MAPQRPAVSATLLLLSLWGCSTFLSEPNEPATDSSSIDNGPPSDVDAEHRAKGTLGEPCDSAEDCESGLCIPGDEGSFCTETCVSECPAGSVCKATRLEGQDPAFFCVPEPDSTCTTSNCDDDDPCTEDGCLEDGTCSNTPITECCQTDSDCDTLDGPCTAGVCNSQTGVCWQTVLEGFVCQPTANCPISGTCDAEGECVDPGTQTRINCMCSDDVDCDDGLDCTLDTCSSDNTCEHLPGVGFCLIEGTCVADGSLEPENACGQCDSDTAPLAWSSVECNDGNTCTDDLCDAAQGCLYSTLPDNSPCDDADTCSTDDACQDGVCVGSCACSEAADCTGPINTCQLWTCEDFSCVAIPHPELVGQACDDGLFCTENTACEDGLCAGGTALDCSAEGDDVCTAGLCHEESDQCVAQAVPDQTACSDGLACTEGDVCLSGNCAGTPKDCSNLTTPCSVGVCNEQAGACESVIQSDSICDDGEACTLNDTCNAAGLCVGTWDNVDCGCSADSDCAELSDACHIGHCDLDTHSCFATPTPGNSCDDSNPCTHSDTCNSNGGCEGSAYSCEPEQSCQTSACDGTGGCNTSLLSDFCLIDNACVVAGVANPSNPCVLCQPSASLNGWSLAQDGIACDSDNNGCTQDDQCQAGTCQAGTAVACPADGLTCTDATCSSTGENSFECEQTVSAATCLIDGICFQEFQNDPNNHCQKCKSQTPTSWTPKSTGSNCSDSDACTENDACNGSGICTSGAPKNCNDNLSCTADACSGGTCSNTTQSGFCVIGGVCISAGTSNPNNACQECNASQPNNWSNKNSGSSCDDGNACTEGDSCNGLGGCSAGTDKNCNDGLSCTSDNCSSGTCSNTIQSGFCVIGGVCRSAGTSNPNNACQECNASQPNNWSNKSSGSSCDDGNACTEGDSCNGLGGCTAGTDKNCNDGLSCTSDNCSGGTCSHPVQSGFCLISGVCLSAGTSNPNNACQECNASQPNNWSNKSSGSSCDDGDACTEGDSCNGLGSCGAGPDKDCSDGLSCTSDSCKNGTCSSALNTNFCLINNTCYSDGQKNTVGSCLSCDTSKSQSSFSNAPVGSFCLSGFCEGFCSTQGLCVGPGPGEECF